MTRRRLLVCAGVKVTEILKRATSSSDNLSLGERKAIKELKSYDDILIINAGKGNCTVLMDKTDYDN